MKYEKYNMKKLPKRLQAIADCIENGAAVADIGTDHGKLPVYLALKGTAQRIIASDISEGSLNAARALTAKHNVTNKIEIIHAPGLSALKSTDANTIVISGVGGETIINILQETPWVKDKYLKLILQPQTKLELLREYLQTNGYEINEEKTVLDRGREYKILLTSTRKEID